jgi:adenylyltransferase/sulfurtransferase
MKSITATELAKLIADNADLQLIDVREPEEHEAFNIGGELIPLSDIIQQVSKIAIHKPVIVYCRKGIRSQVAIQRLQEKFQMTNLINLIGGTEAWKKTFIP